MVAAWIKAETGVGKIIWIVIIILKDYNIYTINDNPYDKIIIYEILNSSL